MKIQPTILLSLALASCVVTKSYEHQEQATLTCYIREADNRGILKLQTSTGKEVVYYNKTRGMGKAQWAEGDKYTVHFNSKGNIIKITKNQ